MYFLIEDKELWKNIMIFGIKSAVLWKKNLKARASTIKNSENQNKILRRWGYRFLW